mgnify:CR=1 FL=1
MGGPAEYPRMIRPGHKPFDPIELAKRTEAIVCRRNEEGELERKYTAFYTVGVYKGIATGYVCGCNLRCYFCWSSPSRDYPESRGRFHSPRAAMAKLLKCASRSGVKRLRISGGEPTIGRSHLLSLLELAEESGAELFLLETNGILFGADPSYVRDVAKFRKVHVRVSIKAGTPEAFQARTGAQAWAFELPFKAIELLLDSGVSMHVALMCDPRLMGEAERAEALRRLAELEPSLIRNLEEEDVDPYGMAMVRLRAAGVNIF